jgi:tRNA pseudouridine38-40 synthase
MQKYKLTISYDGTHYGGWQVQKNALSIQHLVQTALTTLLKTPTLLTGSGRTDAGVHALAQVAHFTAEKELDPFRFAHALNALLPLDIRITKVEKVDSTFHARYDAISKTYYYHLRLDSATNPFTRLYSTHVPYPLDCDLLKKACEFFIGTHDFTSFTNKSHLGINCIRTIYRIDIVEEEGGIRLEFEGNGFLYKMVRNIVGTLLDVSKNKRPLSDIALLLTAKDRKLASEAAPPHGLFLAKVKYE